VLKNQSSWLEKWSAKMKEPLNLEEKNDRSTAFKKPMMSEKTLQSFQHLYEASNLDSNLTMVKKK
jgi:hypothetical protein